MPEYPQLVHLSVPELIGSAGGNPWEINDTIASGAPGEISELAQSFYGAGVSMAQTSEEFAAAKKRFTAAWDRDDPEHPINDSAEVQRATRVMQLNREALTRVGADLQNIAASLAEAQRGSHISISGLNTRLVQIDNVIAAEIAKARAEGVQLDWSELKSAAIREVMSRLGEVTAVRDAYGRQLNASRVEMAAEGYDPAAVDGAAPKPAAPHWDRPVGSQPRNLDDALDHIAGATVPAAVTPVAPPPADPREMERAKAALRNMLREQGLPPDQIESQLNAMVAQAERGLPPGTRGPDRPRPPPPGFGEGVADRWFSTEQAVKNLVGQGGPGAPGVLESWGELVKGTAETVVNPVGATVDEIKHAVSSPSPAYYLGEKTFDAASTAASLPFGGEAGMVRAGLPTKTLFDGGAPEALIRGYHPYGGQPMAEFDAQYGPHGARIWPENDGFPPGYEPKIVDLEPGTVIDRFGYDTGEYLAPNLTPLGDRSLRPESVVAPYTRYEVTDEPLPHGWHFVEGPVAPWFGQTPSPDAIQYKIVGPDGEEVNVHELFEYGVLKEYGPVLGFEVP